MRPARPPRSACSAPIWPLLGTEDLFNSKGTRLGSAAAIIRQDRANFHKFGIRHQYDQADPWFGTVSGRNGMERLVRMSAFTEDIIVRQGALVAVTVFGTGARISRITVEIPG